MKFAIPPVFLALIGLSAVARASVLSCGDGRGLGVIVTSAVRAQAAPADPLQLVVSHGRSTLLVRRRGDIRKHPHPDGERVLYSVVGNDLLAADWAILEIGLGEQQAAVSDLIDGRLILIRDGVESSRELTCAPF